MNKKLAVFISFVSGLALGIVLMSLAFAIPTATESERQYLISTEHSAAENIFGIPLNAEVLFVANLTGREESNGAYYRNLNIVALDANASYSTLSIIIPHELCHEAMFKLNCRFQQQNLNEKICDMYAYYRRPFVYQYIENKDAPLFSSACLDSLFRSFSESCKSGNVLDSFRKLCGVAI